MMADSLFNEAGGHTFPNNGNADSIEAKAFKVKLKSSVKR
jgi:hypothetical protein